MKRSQLTCAELFLILGGTALMLSLGTGIRLARDLSRADEAQPAGS